MTAGQVSFYFADSADGRGADVPPIVYNKPTDEEENAQAEVIKAAMRRLDKKMPERMGRFDYFNEVVPEMENG